MNTETFAIWKFKAIEGRLKNFYASEFFVTKYHNGSRQFEIHYDITKMQCLIKSNCNEFKSCVCSMKDLIQTLKDMGVYEEADRTECHASAFIPMVTQLTI